MSKEQREEYRKFIEDNIYCILKGITPVGFSTFYIYLSNGIVFAANSVPQEFINPCCKYELICQPFLYDSWHTNWKDASSKHFEEFDVEDYNPLTDIRNRNFLFGWEWLSIMEPELSIMIVDYIKDMNEENPRTVLKNRVDIVVPWRDNAEEWWKG